MCQIQLHTAPTLLNAWQKYGFGSLPNGYLKMINPDEYQGPLHDSCVLSSTAVPIFVTAFADIPTWEKAGLSALSSTKTACLRGVAAGFDLFWGDLADGIFDTAFEIPNYKAAVKKWGQLQFDECFGYTPLLGLGGNRKVDNLRKVKIKEHIGLITQSAGKAGTQSSLACDKESTSANRKWVGILGLAYFFIDYDTGGRGDGSYSIDCGAGNPEKAPPQNSGNHLGVNGPWHHGVYADTGMAMILSYLPGKP